MYIKMNKSTQVLAFIVGAFLGSLSYLVAFLALIAVFTVDKSLTPVSEWVYIVAGLVGWLSGGWLELKSIR